MSLFVPVSVVCVCCRYMLSVSVSIVGVSFLNLISVPVVCACCLFSVSVVVVIFCRGDLNML